jgi:hypothetical protein
MNAHLIVQLHGQNVQLYAQMLYTVHKRLANVLNNA